MPVVGWICLSLSLVLAGAARGDSAESTQPNNSPRLVLRISREFLRDLLGREVNEQHPVALTVNRATIVGTARVSLVAGLKADADSEPVSFEFRLEGTITDRSVATRRPVRVQTRGESAVSASRRVMFDGSDFLAAPAFADVSYRSSLERVAPVRRGPVPAVIAAAARPIVRRQLPEVERESERRVRDQVREELTRESDQAVEVLNDFVEMTRRTNAMLQQAGIPLERARPRARLTDDAILVGIGFVDGERLELPPRAELAAPAEIWLARSFTPAEERSFLGLRSAADRMWNERVRPHVRPLLAEHSPNLLKALDAASNEVIVDPIPGDARWHVIRLGRALHSK